MRFFVSAVIVFAAGCSGHIAQYEPKRRNYEPPVASEPAKEEPATAGSLMQKGSLGTSLFTDARSFGVGDLITVAVIEESRANRSASTDLQKDSSLDLGFDVAGMLSGAGGAIDPGRLMYHNSRTNFRGGGRTQRADSVRFVVTAAVRKVLPNGDLFIEGDRVVKVNDEEHHFYVSGVARPTDIDNDNRIMSNHLAEAEIEFFGDGVLSRRQEQGWFMRFLDWFWPF